MIFNNFTCFYSETEIDFSTELEKQQSTKRICELLNENIHILLQHVKGGQFDSTFFSFEKKKRSGLTKCAGLYAIVNSRTQKIYVGGTTNLSQRKGEHKKGLLDGIRSTKFLKSFEIDLQIGEASDFSFVPLVVLPKSVCQYFLNGKEFQKFIEEKLETPLLQEFLSNPEDSVFFYNRKITGLFQRNNTFGGSPQSGIPNQAIQYEEYAWESVSAAAKSLQVDRKSIRNKRDQGIFSPLTQIEYENFQGTQISNVNAENFFVSRVEKLFSLKNSLGFRSFKNNSSKKKEELFFRMMKAEQKKNKILKK